MLLHGFDEDVSDGMRTLAASVRWEDADRPEQRLHIQGPVGAPFSISCGPTAFLPIAAVAAHVHREERVAVDGVVDAALAAGLADACTAFNGWDGGHRTRLRFELRTLQEVPVAPSASSAVLLTGGIDSAASLIENHRRYRPTHPRRIGTALVVYGLDESTDGDPLAPDQFLRAIGREFEVDLLTVRTNVRVLDPSLGFWWHHGQTATWSTVAHAFGQVLTDVVIGADDPIGQETLRGSDTRLDPCFSSTHLRLHHGACGLSRMERVALVAGSDVCLRNLQVCNQPRTMWRPLNCGRCEKCLRTMLALLAIGALDRSSAFPPGGLTPAAVRSVDLHDDLRADYAEMVSPLESAGHLELAAAVRAALRRNRFRQSKALARRADERLFGGVLGRSVVRRAHARGAARAAPSGRSTPIHQEGMPWNP